MAATEWRVVKLCYNKGCAQNFVEEENKNDCCRFHPGAPVFHDAYKSWSCCNKRTTDFTEFLNIKGCTVGPHNPIKPVEAPKPKQEIPDTPVAQETRGPVAKSMERPPSTQKMVRLPYKVGASLKPLLDKLSDAGDARKDRNVEVGQVPIGTQCKNSGCKSTFQGEHTNSEACLFHNGAPIFHEGMKYWSCCQRKTSDFSAFLEQEGCSTGKHIWFKQKAMENTVSCRHDWHQTGSQVVISVFAKASFPDKSFVDLNPVRCRIHIVFGEDRAVFDSDIDLAGIVDVSASSVEFLGSKVEICMKKAEAVSWRTLVWTKPAAEADSGDFTELAEDLDERVNLDDVEVLVNKESIEDAKKRFFKYENNGQVEEEDDS